MSKGFNEITGLYTTRYYANKNKKGDEVVIKVTGGYKIMSVLDYRIWRKQK